MKSIYSILSLILTAVLISSCSGNNTENDSSTNNENTNDSTTLEQNPLSGDLKIIYDLFPESSTFPVKIDSTFIKNAEKGDTLLGDQIRLLTKNYTKGKFYGDLDWNFKSFYEIDSLKKAKAYTKWAETRDLGDVKYSNCYALQKIKLSDETTLLIWSLSYSTYEACPYGYGTYILATILYKDALTDCFNIAEYSGGGDPPVSGMETRYCTISNDGKINVDYTAISDEDNEMPNVDVTYGKLKLEVNTGKFIIKEEKQEASKSISRIKMNYN